MLPTLSRSVASVCLVSRQGYRACSSAGHCPEIAPLGSLEHRGRGEASLGEGALSMQVTDVKDGFLGSGFCSRRM